MRVFKLSRRLVVLLLACCPLAAISQSSSTSSPPASPVSAGLVHDTPGTGGLPGVRIASNPGDATVASAPSPKNNLRKKR